MKLPADKPKNRLVIVESPTKARTISRFLPPEYRVEASMGHVRDLPSSAAEIPAGVKGESWARLGVNVDDGFKPIYVVSPRKRDVVKKLKAAIKAADEVYIATDEDREGESIGWHLIELLEPQVPVHRMVFHEITEKAILDALDNTRAIDGNLVEAQETRRILDRLVGYAISPLLWRKIAPRLSAGRVQSVAVRLLVMRERERLEFMPASYWDLSAQLAKGAGADQAFGADLTHVGAVRVAQGRDYDPNTGRLKSELSHGHNVIELSQDQASALVASARAATWKVAALEEREASRSPAAAFTTSTLQQEASRKLSLAAKDTMRVAQSLYENGYITYMRTDSINLSAEAVTAARTAIVERYGDRFLVSEKRTFKQASRNAQEAHEAIRPAGTEMKTAEEHGLRGTEAALYDLIWKRTIATQMADARLKFVTARIEAAPQDRGPVTALVPDAASLTFRASGRTVLFPGFFRAYVEGSDDPDAALDDRDQPLPDLAKDDGLNLLDLEATGHETKPPARFTDASLVKLLESEGIGRPSTYASIIDTIQARGYARKQGQQLVPTFTAFATTNLLEHQFRRLVDTEFTASMETVLDNIAAGQQVSTTYLHDFYLGSDGIVKRVEQGIEGIDPREISTVRTDKWEPYLVRVGRYGPYVEGSVDGETMTASLPPDTAPGDLDREDLATALSEGNIGDVTVAVDPESQEPVLLKRGPFGPYLQLGEGVDGAKPKRVSLPQGVSPHDVNSTLALDLIALPKNLGPHPESGEPVDVGIGRYGPYVKHQRTYASLPKELFLLDATFEQALELLAKKAQRGGGALRELGTDPTSDEVVDVREGRYGPYVKRGKVNASLPKDLSPDDVTLEQAIDLLNVRAAAAPKTGAKAKGTKKAGAKAKTTGTKAGAKTKAKTAGTKAKKTTAKAKTATKPTTKAATTKAKAAASTTGTKAKSAARTSAPTGGTKPATSATATSED